MDSGFEALPQRTGGRGKRRRPADGVGGEDGPAVPPPPTSHGVVAGAEDVSSVGVDDRAADLTAPCLVDVESTSGEERWEYLDHTADVLVHTCALKK